MSAIQRNTCALTIRADHRGCIQEGRVIQASHRAALSTWPTVHRGKSMCGTHGDGAWGHTTHQWLRRARAVEGAVVRVGRWSDLSPRSGNHNDKGAQHPCSRSVGVVSCVNGANIFNVAGCSIRNVTQDFKFQDANREALARRGRGPGRFPGHDRDGRQ